jgi:hypothetical protein
MEKNKAQTPVECDYAGENSLTPFAFPVLFAESPGSSVAFSGDNCQVAAGFA